MSSYDEYTGSDQVHVGNGKRLHISHIDHGSLSFPHSFLSFQLFNILHVSSIFNNLLFVQQFAKDNNIFFKFHPSYFFMKD